MIRFSDLPDIILLQVLDYLSADPNCEALVGAPFCYWPVRLSNQIAATTTQSKDVKSLVLTCKKLYHIGLRALYARLHVEQSRYMQKQYLDLLNATLETNDDLGAFIKTAHIDLDEGDAGDIFRLFFLPNIQTLTLKKFSAAEAMEFEEPHDVADWVSTSPLRTLYLMECGAREAPLSQILSWPAELKELYYDCEQIEWESYCEGEDPGRFSLKGVERSLASQAESLVKLIFSRERQPHEGLHYPEGGDHIDFSFFTQLKSLCINQVFIIGYESDRAVKHMLPKGLKELEIYYDDSGYQDFLSSEAPRPGWLFNLLEGKPEHTPELQRIRITSPEWEPWMDENSDGQEDNTDEETTGDEADDLAIPHARRLDLKWRPPQDLMSAFLKAEVSFSIYLHSRRRFKHIIEGSQDFEDPWEDTWKS